MADSSGANVLRLEGAADVRAARRLLEAAKVCARAPGDVVVDCSALERLDASAVQILFALKKAVEGAGRTVLMRAVPERIAEMLMLVGAVQALADGAAPVESVGVRSDSGPKRPTLTSRSA